MRWDSARPLAVPAPSALRAALRASSHRGQQLLGPAAIGGEQLLGARSSWDQQPSGPEQTSQPSRHWPEPGSVRRPEAWGGRQGLPGAGAGMYLACPWPRSVPALQDLHGLLATSRVATWYLSPGKAPAVLSRGSTEPWKHGSTEHLSAFRGSLGSLWCFIPLRSSGSQCRWCSPEFPS